MLKHVQREERTAENQNKSKSEGGTTQSLRSYYTKALSGDEKASLPESRLFQHPRGRNKEESPSAVKLR